MATSAVPGLPDAAFNQGVGNLIFIRACQRNLPGNRRLISPAVRVLHVHQDLSILRAARETVKDSRVRACPQRAEMVSCHEC